MSRLSTAALLLLSGVSATGPRCKSQVSWLREKKVFRDPRRHLKVISTVAPKILSPPLFAPWSNPASTAKSNYSSLVNPCFCVRMCSSRFFAQTNTNVDWWIIYKFPVLTTMPDGTAWRNGYGYAYMDSNDPTKGLVPASPQNTSSLQDAKMLLTYTLDQVYANAASDSVGYYMYNDEKPDGSTSSYRGHTKGVTVFDANGGFFLDHSVPRWPPLATDAYEFPEMEASYGQSFMCVSLDAKALETVYGNWLYTYPNVYSQSIPVSLQATYPNLVQVSAGKHVTAVSTRWFCLQPVTSKFYRACPGCAHPQSTPARFVDWCVVASLMLTWVASLLPKTPSSLAGAVDQRGELQHDRRPGGDVPGQVLNLGGGLLGGSGRAHAWRAAPHRDLAERQRTPGVVLHAGRRRVGRGEHPVRVAGPGCGVQGDPGPLQVGRRGGPLPMGRAQRLGAALGGGRSVRGAVGVRRGPQHAVRAAVARGGRHVRQRRELPHGILQPRHLGRGVLSSKWRERAAARGGQQQQQSRHKAGAALKHKDRERWDGGRRITHAVPHTGMRHRVERGGVCFEKEG